MFMKCILKKLCSKLEVRQRVLGHAFHSKTTGARLTGDAELSLAARCELGLTHIPLSNGLYPCPN